MESIKLNKLVFAEIKENVKKFPHDVNVKSLIIDVIKNHCHALDYFRHGGLSEMHQAAKEGLEFFDLEKNEELLGKEL